MKSSRGTDLLPWILVALSAVIMGVAVGVYSSDASATDTALASETAPSLMDASGADMPTAPTSGVGSAIYGPAPETADHATAPQPHPAQL